MDIAQDELPTERALGLFWNVEDDTLGFKVKFKKKPATRRGILSIVNSVYDPLGLGVPVVQPVKVLMQRLCKLKLGWDDPIPQSEEKVWLMWLEQLPMLTTFRVPRSYKPKCFGKVVDARLHYFSDASLEAYGAVSYLRLEDENSNVHCVLVFGRSRLVPMRSISVPRLELSAATIAVRSDIMLREQLHIPELSAQSVFWTDSTTILRYLNNEDRAFHTFVANRVQTIKDSSLVSQWKHVPTASNPADDASRGLTVKNSLKRDRWINGPIFLWKPEADWPVQPSFINCLSEDDPEVKRSKVMHSVTSNEPRHLLDELICRYSSWFKLKKVCAWLLRCKAKFLNLSHAFQTDEVSKNVESSVVTIEELEEAEKFIFAHLQKKHFATEVSDLSSGKQLKKSSRLIKLDPIFVDGLLRVGGRLRNSTLPYDTKHPIILPSDSPASVLIVQSLHISAGHMGRNHVLSRLRERFWILKANSTVRKVLSKCVSCRRRQGRTSVQKMADLPPDRATPNEPPFTFVAINYFGPFLIRQGRSEHKRYGVVFTCLVIRAVHIEIAHSLDTSSFIQALRRFISRRGIIREIRTDNGSNFIGAERELREAIENWNQNQIITFLQQKCIKWKFNVPLASHHGGVWERQIRLIRKILYSICSEQRLTDESLSTFMCEVEEIINSRPLTTSSDDPQDLNPITPNHLLNLKNNCLLPPGVFDQKDVYSRKRWKQIQYLADVFWSRWTKEYLPLLQRRQRWEEAKKNLKENDVVLIADKTPRNSWLLGRVSETIPDKHGIVRSVRLQTQHSVVVRPVSKLCLLLEY